MSDNDTLSDYGGGAPDPTPEDKVKIDLSRWFDTLNVDIYWEKRPSYGYQTFQTNGKTDHPDLLVDGQRHTFAIEVKSGTDGGGIHDGVAQTKRYWTDYVNGDKQYRLYDGDVSIDAFILATKYSMAGRLYSNEYDMRDRVRETHVRERLSGDIDPPIHFLPDWEFTSTETATRTLWRFCKMEQSNNDLDAVDAGVGVLLSDVLDGTQPENTLQGGTDPLDRSDTPTPKALYRSFNGGSGFNVHNWRPIE